jgi:hypothetical protein
MNNSSLGMKTVPTGAHLCRVGTVEAPGKMEGRFSYVEPCKVKGKR